MYCLAVGERRNGGVVDFVSHHLRDCVICSRVTYEFLRIGVMFLHTNLLAFTVFVQTRAENDTVIFVFFKTIEAILNRNTLTFAVDFTAFLSGSLSALFAFRENIWNGEYFIEILKPNVLLSANAIFRKVHWKPATFFGSKSSPHYSKRKIPKTFG